MKEEMIVSLCGKLCRPEQVRDEAAIMQLGISLTMGASLSARPL
jgi:hypothetical protein